MDLPAALPYVAFGIQGLYYAVLLRFGGRGKEPEAPSAWPSLSILICARDEAANLSRNLPAVLEQDYPGDWEVLVVDDGSSDDTPKTLEQLKYQYSRLKTLTVSPAEKQGSGKKYALRKGVESATGEVVLLTDADCRPASAGWARKMAAALGEKAIVLGVSPFFPEPGFANVLAEYETATTALQYTAYARAGSPYMGVGRNLGFRRSVFLQKAWTEAEMLLPSGDDDRFVQTEAHGGNTAVCSDPEAYTFSRAPEDLGAWYRQKKRHLATGYTYRTSHRILLGGFLLSKALFYLCLLFTCTSLSLVLAYALLLLFVQYSCKHLNSRWFLGPLLDPAYVFSIIFTGIAGRIRPQRSWK